METRHGTIRSFRDSDAKNLSALIRNTLLVSNLADYPMHVIANLYRAYSPRALIALARRRRIFLYEQDRRTVGTASLEDGQIQAVFVAPDAQGRGVGRALMMCLEAIAREKGEMELSVSASLTAARFYERIGYREVGTGGDEIYGPVVRMRKIL